MNNEFTRRTFVAALAAGLTPTSAFSQASLCHSDPTFSNLSAPLTIDTHAHFFNGSDLQIKQFLSQTTVGPDSELYPLVQGMGGLLQHLAWHLAPSARAEISALAKYASKLQVCESPSRIPHLPIESFQAGYRLGRRQLQASANALQQTTSGAAVLGPTLDQPGLAASIADLPESYEAFEDRRADTRTVLGSQPTLLGYIQFVLHHFNFRHVNALDYLMTYSKGSARKVDLVVPSMVDYDWWLARGRTTPTSLPEQVDVMSQLSVLLGGRVHGFVPFCPFREAMTLDSNGVGDGMRLVRRAIETGGFIGVKLYPPMGFAPWGNTGKTVWRGKRSLPNAASAPDFGTRLDAAMQSLFSFCVVNDVPVMAHTNHSNGPYDEFKALAGSGYWEMTLNRFPGLSVNFGHFGDTDLEDHEGDRTLPFVQLMNSAAGSPGAKAFADSGYFAGALFSQGRMVEVLRSLYGAEKGVMLERLMYGTDWTMILPQKNVEHYLSDFMDVMRRIEEAEPGIRARQTSLSEAFFGRNAVEYLGLRTGRGNRRRLEAFYERHKLAEPDWLNKVGMA